MVRLKVAGVATATTLAVTLYPPAVAFAVAVTLATPLPLVTALAADSAALAPLPGTTKFTVTPATGLPPRSFTVTCNGFANAVLIPVDCGVPPVAVTLAAVPAVLVRLKVAGVATPATLAVTL